MTGRIALPALTGIRGVAAWLVVLYHIRGAAAGQLPAPLLHAFGKGYLAVDLFFMLSGFVLWLNYADRIRGEGLRAAPRFLVRRIARIWPLHMLILAGAIALALLLAALGRPNPVDYPWGELPLHILLVQNWGFTADLTWNDPAWSISCELAAYLLFPLLALSADWSRLPSAALIALMLALGVTLHLVFAFNGEDRLGADIPHLGLPRALAEFAMGTIACALWQRWHAAPRRPLMVSLATAAALALTATAGILAETAAVPALFAAILLAVALAPDNPLGWRWARYLGEISYATYLLHFLLFIAFKLLFVSDAGDVPLPLLGLFLLATLLGSVLLHHLVERPAQHAVNRAFDRVTPIRDAPPLSRPVPQKPR